MQKYTKGRGLILSLHHVQLAMPRGGEDAARVFYGLLGFTPVEKPEPLRGRGGIWFETEGVRVHLGVEDPFRPARKAHPAFEVVSLDEARAALDRAGVAWRPEAVLPGISRLFVDDPFGNRIELLETIGSR